MQTTRILANTRTSKSHPKRDCRQPAVLLQVEQSKENYSAFRCCNTFLKTTFQPIGQKALFNDSDIDKQNYLTQSNYEYLRDSAFQYARLLNAELKHNSSNDISTSISNLYKEFTAILSDSDSDLCLNIDIEEQRLNFVIYKAYKWCPLYWLPMKFIESIDEELQQIAVLFINELSKSNDIPLYFNSQIFTSTIEDLEETYDQYDDSEEKQKEYENILISYSSGEIYKLFQRIRMAPPCRELPEIIRKIQPKQEREKNLFKIFEEGLQFIGNDLPSFKDFEYDSDFDPDIDYLPLDFNSSLLIFYDDDWVARNVIDRFNGEWEASYIIDPCCIMKLSPKTDKLFVMDDYPVRFLGWCYKFTSFIFDNYE